MAIEGNPDHTLGLLCGSNLPFHCKVYQTPPEEPPNADEPPEGSTPTHTTVESPVADFKATHRIHTRIVFKEVCDLRGDMQMLLGVLKGLNTRSSQFFVHLTDL